MQRMPWGLLIVAGLLTCVGFLAIWDAAPASEIWLRSYVAKQMIAAAIGIGVGMVVFFIKYYRYRDLAYPLYALCLAGLLLVDAVGGSQLGAKRWISFGGFNFQPSEPMKLGIVFCLARYMMFRDNLAKLHGLIGPAVLTFIPMALVLVQPDLGTSLVFIPVFLAMIFVAGADTRHLIGAIILGVAAMPPAYYLLLKDYQRKRLLAFLDPSQLDLEEGYQLIRAKIAIGSGGVFGRLWSDSEIDYSRYVPIRHNDFISTVIAEEVGFVGATVLLILFALLIWFCMRVAQRTREPFGRLLVVGITTFLGVQIAINMGMNIGLAPVTGITLPFVSYGGSSLITSFIAIAVIVNVAVNQTPGFAGKEFDDMGGRDSFAVGLDRDMIDRRR